MAEDRLVEHQRVFHCTAYQFGIGNRRTVVGTSGGAGGKEDSEFGQFVSFAVLTDAAERIDAAVARTQRQLPNQFNRGLCVERRLGVGTAGD